MFHGLMVEKYVNKKLILTKKRKREDEKKNELKPGILDNKIDMKKEAQAL